MRTKVSNLLQPASRGAVLLLSAITTLLLVACSPNGGNQAPPAPEVGVIKTVAQPVSINEEYVAQTEAMETVEIRARVSGILERQSYVDGAHVSKDQVLFVIDQQPFIAALAQAKAALAQAQASHVNSRQVLDRIRPLLADHAISQQDLDAAVAKEAVDAANEDAAKAQMKTAELNLDYTTIRASRDGMISKALIKVGGLVNASTTLLTTLYSVDPVYVNFTLSEQKLLDMQKRAQGQPAADKRKATVYRVKLVDGSVYAHPGQLNFVDAAVDPRTGTLQVRLLVPNPERALRPGQFVRVIVPGVEIADAIRVPQQAVQEMQGRRSVFVVDADGKVAYREIVANTRLENDWIVEGGLKPDETIIVEGVNKVRPGAQVRPTPYVPGGRAAADGKGEPAKDGAGAAKGAPAKADQPAEPVKGAVEKSKG